MGLFGLKISLGMARVFLMEAALTVLPPDFLSVGGNTNQEVLFVVFFWGSLTALMI
jgi:hypothetical protein